MRTRPFAMTGFVALLFVLALGRIAQVNAQAVFVISETKLFDAVDPAREDFFGHSVDINGDTAVIGVPLDDDDDCPPVFYPLYCNSGSAYVYKRSATGWSRQAKLTASDATRSDNFGISVAISGDTIVVGANGAGEAGINSGSAYVFEFDGTNWVEKTELIPSDGVNTDQFGRSLAVSGDTIVVGAFNHSGPALNSGAAYIFTYDGSSWIQTDKLTASDANFHDWFGWSVAIRGNTVIAGSLYGDGAAGSSGSAYVVEFDGVDWIETAKLVAHDGATSD